MAVAHGGLASLAVDLHEVRGLLALTNSLVKLHNLVGGSQVTPSQSRRHLYLVILQIGMILVSGIPVMGTNEFWKCRHVLMALPTNGEWVEGHI